MTTTTTTTMKQTVTSYKAEEKSLSASGILKDSIDDIDNNLWFCHTLTNLPDEDRPAKAKPMGCALGLIGINGNCMKADGRNPNKFYLGYPEEYPWTPEAIQAMEILAECVPEEWVVESYNTRDKIIQYNDHTIGIEAPEMARKWFDEAYKLALSRGL